MSKIDFIRFLKDNHAFDEFKEAIGYDFNVVWEEFKDIPEALLEDGVVFFYINNPEKNWEVLRRKWIELYPPTEQSCDNCIYFECGNCTNAFACVLDPNLENRWEMRK